MITPRIDTHAYSTILIEPLFMEYDQFISLLLASFRLKHLEGGMTKKKGWLV